MRNSQHKEGYKKTKLGWIPEEWKLVRLEKVCTIIMGQSPKSENYNNQGIGLPLIQGAGDFSSVRNPKTFTSQVTKECIENDLIMSVRAPVGSLLKSPSKFCLGRGVCAIRPKKMPLDYLENLLSYYSYRWRRLKQGSTFSAISSRDIKQFIIPIGLSNEQQKIAEILATWDTAIQKLDKLIKAKEKQKKALMQQLLSGKKRFAEFEGEEWVEVKLGSVVSRKERKTEKPDNEYLSIGIRSHGLGTFQKPDKDPDDNKMTHLYQVKEDDLIVNITFAWEGAIAVVKKEDTGGYVSHRFPTYIFNRKKLLPEYFKYVIIQPRMFYLLGVISPGGAGRNRVLNKKDFINLKIDLPSTEEQQKIGAILTKVDEEIEELEQLLKKYEQQKKGLMQQLLTGQTRVTHLLSDQPKKAAS